MDDFAEFESTNINGLWLQNIFENLKNLENLQRVANEGCTSLMDYMQLTQQQRDIFLADTQYKNLRYIVTEIELLLTDLTPVLRDKADEYRNQLDLVKKDIDVASLFITEQVSEDHRIMYRKVTPYFWETIKYLTKLKIEIIKAISKLLYVEAT